MEFTEIQKLKKRRKYFSFFFIFLVVVIASLAIYNYNLVGQNISEFEKRIAIQNFKVYRDSLESLVFIGISGLICMSFFIKRKEKQLNDKSENK